MKVGFIITAHHSDKFRPQGGKFLLDVVNSIISSCKYNFKIYIIDNASEYELSYPNDKRIIFNRIDNQFEGGLTYAWNMGIDIAYKDGCDILLNCNDDLIFNFTINNFIEKIKIDNNSNVIYSALTNGVYTPSYQGDIPNGFFFGFISNHYKKFRYKEHEYFNKDNKHNGNDGKWGGQEGQFIENADRGLYSIIVNECWIYHDKVRGWAE